MPKVKVTGIFSVQETRIIDLTDEKYQEAVSSDDDFENMLLNGAGECVDYVTLDVDDVKWELLPDEEETPASTGG